MKRFGVVVLGTAVCKIDWFHLFDCGGDNRRENDKPIDGAHTPKNSVKTCAIVRLDCADLCRSNSMFHPTGNRINRKSIRLTALYFWRFNRNMSYTQRPLRHLGPYKGLFLILCFSIRPHIPLYPSELFVHMRLHTYYMTETGIN